MRTCATLCLALLFPLLTLAQDAALAPLLPGIVETPADEYGPTLTPDGKELFFVRRANRSGKEAIWHTRRTGSTWGEASVAPFSGTYYDKEPFIAPDGNRIFFASTRHSDARGDDAFDLWMVERQGDTFSEPVRLPAGVNSPRYDNYPSVAANGNLYFASNREGSDGYDLYVARYRNGAYQPAERLGPTINSPSTEADPYIAPDESYLIFCSTRSGGMGSGDLYISWRSGDGWSAPINLGAPINTDDFEYTPLVTPDGQQLYFSRGWGEIFEIAWSEVEALKSE